MAALDDHHLVELVQAKAALKRRVNTLCDHFDDEAVRFVPDGEVSLFNGLVLIGTALVRILDGELDEWIDETVATLGAGEQGDLVREYIRLFYEAETQRLLKHILATVDEEMARRGR